MIIGGRQYVHDRLADEGLEDRPFDRGGFAGWKCGVSTD